MNLLKRTAVWLPLLAVVIVAAGTTVLTLRGADSDSRRHVQYPSVSAYQQAILADGEVTDEEMEAAVRKTVSCLQEQGFNAEFLPKEVGWAPPTFRIITSDEPVAVATATVPCKTEYMSELGITYAVNREPQDAAFGPDEHIARVEACIADAGFPLEGRYENSWHYARQEELAAAPGGFAAWEACVSRVQAERFPNQ